LSVTRDWAATTFVVDQGRVLLHRHAKLGLWLPPGGHVEPHELPDEAARREVLEESGLRVDLVGDVAVDAPGVQPLVRPRGVQVERIDEGHEHIDLIYFARPAANAHNAAAQVHEGFGWYAQDAWEGLPLTDEVHAWCVLALKELGEASLSRRQALGRTRTDYN
jgi:8-oxo-dGTP pyrophosphatase MutT (NUDIX family)